jgi:hypothetical protein
MNLSEEMLKEARDVYGCLAFGSGGRVDCDGFMEWLAGNPQFVEKFSGEGGVPSKAISLAVRAHYDAMEAKRKYEQQMRKVILRTKFAEIVRRVGERQRNILKPHVTPETLAKICEEMQPLFDECKA